MPKTSISWKSIWIYLKSQVKSSFEIWKFDLNLQKFYFVWKSSYQVVPFMCIQIYRVIMLNPCTLHHSASFMYLSNKWAYPLILSYQLIFM